MSYEKKEPPSANVSLARIAWSFKELVEEIKKQHDSKDPRDEVPPSGDMAPRAPQDDLPF